MKSGAKLLLIILDGVPERNFRRLFGNLEGWVEYGDGARLEDALGAAVDLGPLLRLDPYRRAAASPRRPRQ